LIFLLVLPGVSGFGFITLAPAMLRARPFGGELNGDSKVCDIVIVVVLVIGAIRSLYLIYCKIVEATEGVLTTMEDAIENVA
jgi:hypothetical protein